MDDLQTAHFSTSESNREVSPKHDARFYTPDNAEASLADRNEHIMTTLDLKTAVNERMWGVIEEYNAKQKRADRKMDHDIYSKLYHGGKNTQPVVEFVVGIGNQDTCGITDREFDVDHWQKLKENGKLDEAAAYVTEHLNDDPRMEDVKRVLLSFAQRFQERFPAFEVIYVHFHGDEPDGSQHLHMGAMPISRKLKEGGYKRGCAEQISFTGACNDSGFSTSTERRFDPKAGKKRNMRITEQMKFEEAARELLAECMEEYGFERHFKGGGKKRKNINSLRANRKAQKMIEAAEAAKQEEAQALANAQQAKEIIEEYTQAVDEERAKLDERETRITKREKAADEKMKQASDIMAREADIEAREAAIEGAEEKAAEILANADEKAEEAVRVRSSAVASREVNAQLKERELKEKEAALDARQSDLDALDATLKARKKRLDEKEEELNDLATRLREALEAANEARIAFIERIKAMGANMSLPRSVRNVMSVLRSTKDTMKDGRECRMEDKVKLAMMTRDKTRGGSTFVDSFNSLVEAAEAGEMEVKLDAAKKRLCDQEAHKRVTDDRGYGE